MGTPANTALVRYLERLEPVYAGKLLEVRAAVEGWLTYVPATFPHYTSHTVAHSDEIIRQISQLLFYENDPERGVLSLSAVEAYILGVAALLHDAGMVVSDSEKEALLASPEWRNWVEDSPTRVEQLAALAAFRADGAPESRDARHFLADTRLRQLIAEFVRRTHHSRVVPILRDNEAALGRVAFGDAALLSTIAAVCEGHGLSHADLDDARRYPDRRDVRGEEVNVRLLAVLLRLGDLLDMAHERACPLLRSAVAPLPPDSIAHWDQYLRVTHRSTAPDEISIESECKTADEHRLIRDWCQWIVDEVAGARWLLARSRRHTGWSPPVARMGGADATISVRVAPDAHYIPSDWKFELDAAAVVQRLVNDVSQESLLFVRELVQNGLDATRRSLSDVVVRDTGDPPSNMATVDAALREARPLRIALRDELRTSPATGEEERTQVIQISDDGTGMSEDDVKQFLLQIGRSYYTTPSFRDHYAFAPTSRFGIGFLSVFRDSDHVKIATATELDVQAGRGGICLTLTGPRNYIVTERGDRQRAGTTIDVRLSTPLQQGVLTALVTSLCLRVEFPIVVDDLGVSTTVTAELPETFCFEREGPREGEMTIVRAFPISVDHVSGEVYVVAHQRKDGSESWADLAWLEREYLINHPADPPLQPPSGALCVNGLRVGAGRVRDPWCMRLDYRRTVPNLGLERASASPILRDLNADPLLTSALSEILQKHLDEAAPVWRDSLWVYQNMLMARFPLEAFWQDRGGVVPVFRAGQQSQLSIAQAAALDQVFTLKYIAGYSVTTRANTEPHPIPWDKLGMPEGASILVDWQLDQLSVAARAALFGRRRLNRITAGAGGFLFCEWSEPLESAAEAGRITLGGHTWVTTELESDAVIGFYFHRVGTEPNQVVLNLRAPLTQWVLRVVEAGTDSSVISTKQIAPLGDLLNSPCSIVGYRREELANYLERWREPNVPTELRPPGLELDEASFRPPETAAP